MNRINFLVSVWLMLCLVSSKNAGATTWRVNDISNFDGVSLWGDNVGGIEAKPVFKTIDQAINAMQGGIYVVNNYDTVHVEGALNTYAAFYLDRPLVIIGTGYLLSENNALFGNVSNNPQLETKIYTDIRFLEGSQNSQLIGCNLLNGPGNTLLLIATSNISIKRCRIEGYTGIKIAGGTISNIYLLENLFAKPGYEGSAIFTSTDGNYTNFYINNNIFQKPFIFSDVNIHFIEECKNNVFDFQGNTGTDPVITIITAAFKNNIIKTANAVVNINGGARNGIITHNYFAVTNTATGPFQFDTSSQYKNVPLNAPQIQNLFIAPAASTDGNYRLRTGTVYNNTGADNTDRGAFGGANTANRYTLSGLAPIPVIYDIMTSGVSNGTGLPVSIKARTIQ